MKGKSIAVLFVIVACLALLVACQEEPESKVSDSYKDAQEAAKAFLGVDLPDLEGVTALITQNDSENLAIMLSGMSQAKYSSLLGAFQKTFGNTQKDGYPQVEGTQTSNQWQNAQFTYVELLFTNDENPTANINGTK